ncbi:MULTISPECIES: hypothetical protein [unclassified Mesorhizobium]|uniref:hypothetical protein n=1 Tax=unclassified Mesorhizobium TaxID=325217 RepID=UPI00112C6307|nr:MULTISPECIES: hypothetical protein [unclassified Mesorhizobium]TPK89074.1 hypothetical protein FJ567_30710 [Mesorhizobium sp. B2-4-16]TPL57377.1 hypothetical protein FJ956_30180 [Mesorhizobium sp. B2-4-3]
MFDIVTAKDFYTVLVQNFDDFMDEPHSARRALHCAITAFHLHEWVWGERLSKDKAARDRMGIRLTTKTSPAMDRPSLRLVPRRAGPSKWDEAFRTRQKLRRQESMPLPRTAGYAKG